MSGAAPRRVLVTGAAGFIGSSLVDRLLAEGREVVGLDNFDSFYPEQAKLRNLGAAMGHPGFRLVRADIRDSAALGRVFGAGGIDGVVHLAALAGVRESLERPTAFADVNVHGTSAVLEAAARSGRPHFVLASSSSVYGERENGPFREEDPVLHPISPYAATKRACELLAHAFHHSQGLGVTCARIFTAYGPRQRPDLAVRKFAERMLSGRPVPIYGDGGSLRDFTFIDDLVDGLVRALDRDLGFAILNFGAGRTVTVLELVKQLEQALAIEAEIEWRPRETGDVTRTWADTSAARAALGWTPRVSFEEGIRRFVAWLREPR
ncbi:MAG: GDP-mannose 4,6-dehydratase [Candidatus Limnocylindria bacterium]